MDKDQDKISKAEMPEKGKRLKIKPKFEINHYPKQFPLAVRIIAGLIVILTVLIAFRIQAIYFQYVDNIFFVFLFGPDIKYLAYVVLIYLCLCVTFGRFIFIRIAHNSLGSILLLLVTLTLFGVIAEWSVNVATTRGQLGKLFYLYGKDWVGQGFSAGNALINFSVNGSSVINGGFIGLIFYVILAGIFSPSLAVPFAMILIVIGYLIALSLIFTSGAIRMYINFYNYIYYAIKTRKTKSKEYYDNQEINQKIRKIKGKISDTLVPPNPAAMRTRDEYSEGNLVSDRNKPTDSSKISPPNNFNIQNHTVTKNYTPIDVPPNNFKKRRKLSRKEQIALSKRNYEKNFNIPDYQRLKAYKAANQVPEKSQETSISDYVGDGIYRSFERTKPKIKRNLSNTQERRIKKFDQDFIDVNPFGMTNKERSKYVHKRKQGQPDLEVRKVNHNQSYSDTARFVNPNHESKEDDAKKK